MSEDLEPGDRRGPRPPPAAYPVRELVEEIGEALVWIQSGRVARDQECAAVGTLLRIAQRDREHAGGIGRRLQRDRREISSVRAARCGLELGCGELTRVTVERQRRRRGP